MAGRNNRSGLRVLWMPGKKKHGHQKKDKVYRSHSRSQDREVRNQGSPYSRRKHQEDPSLSSMAGESPAPITTSAVIPTTTVLASKDLINNEENSPDSELVQTSVVVEPEQQNGHRSTEKLDNMSPKVLNQMNNKPGSKESLERKRQEEAIEMAEDPSMSANAKDELVLMNKTNNNSNNGHVDNIDGILAKTKKKKRKNKKNKLKNEEQKDSCGIKCLSVALQCCECVIS